MLVFCGCNSNHSARDPELGDMPPMVINIPEDIPENLVLIDPQGNETTVKGREIYAAAYRSGWEEYWVRHKRGEVSLADQSTEPLSRQESGIQSRARTDGFRKCREKLIGEIKGDH